MAKEFGSRADMISPKIDEVSRNSIWREHCKKELAHHTLNTNFNIANINKSRHPVAKTYCSLNQTGRLLSIFYFNTVWSFATLGLLRFPVLGFALTRWVWCISTVAVMTIPEKPNYVMPSTKSEWDVLDVISLWYNVSLSSNLKMCTRQPSVRDSCRSTETVDIMTQLRCSIWGSSCDDSEIDLLHSLKCMLGNVIFRWCLSAIAYLHNFVRVIFTLTSPFGLLQWARTIYLLRPRLSKKCAV